MRVNAKKISLSFLCFATLLCYFSAWWAVRTYGSISMEEIVFHLNVPLDGVNTEYIFSYLKTALLPALAVFAAAMAVFGRCCLFLRSRRTYTCLDIRLGKRRWYVELTDRAFSRAMALLLVLGLVLMAAGTDNMLNIGQYLYNQFHKSSFIEEQYVKPDSSLLTFPEKKRNLVYIYLESMEKTFEDRANGGNMDENAIPELTQLARENVTFNLGPDGEQGILPLTSSWTIAAMVAQTSGLPLKIPVEKNSMSKYGSFLPGAVTLGELLEEAGYKNMLMVGSYASFAGRDQYFKEHGNYEIWDFGTAQRTGKVPDGYDIGWWGIEDEKLFAYAKEELTNLAETGQPFNFTVLTVDTHNPDGYVCRLCDSQFDDRYSNVLHCASRQTADFVSWIMEQPWYENTSIVISGDHATMVSGYAPDDDSYDRGVYYCFINPAAEAAAGADGAQTDTADTGFADAGSGVHVDAAGSGVRADAAGSGADTGAGTDMLAESLAGSAKPGKIGRNRTACTMDLFPTTLAAMGVRIEGDRLGLGTNLFSDRDTIVDELGKEEAISQLNMKSVFYDDVLLYGETGDEEAEAGK